MTEILKRDRAADVVDLKAHPDLDPDAAATAPQTSTPHRPRRNRRRLTLSGLAVVAALGAGGFGYHWWITARWLETTDDAYVGGNVTAISPHVAGFVAQILVKDNQPVKAGQLLIRLDDRDVKAAADRAAAVVHQQESTLDNLHAQYRVQQSVIKQEEADLSAATAEAAFTSQDARRYRDLARRDFGSRQAAQRAIAADRKSQAALRGARAGLTAAKQQLSVLDTRIAVAAAAVEEAKAELRTAQLELGYTEIRAPIDGYVGNRAARVGAYVGKGTYLLSLIPSRGLWVDANFKEDQLARMRPGQKVTVSADILSGHRFHGHVASLSPATGSIYSVIPAENATGNFTKIVQRLPVRIALDTDNAALDQLRPGLSTTVTVNTQPN